MQALAQPFEPLRSTMIEDMKKLATEWKFLRIDSKPGRKYALSCKTRVDQPPIQSTGGCTFPYKCQEQAAARGIIWVSCEEPWVGTIADCNVNMTGPYGGWDFIRKWMTDGVAFVQQLDREGWTRLP